MIDRRRLIELGLGCSAAGVTGVGVGYRYRRDIHGLKNRLLPDPPKPTQRAPIVRAFQAGAREIEERQRRQTKEIVRTLKAKYENPVLGRFRVWDLLEKLALCVDPTDASLYCTSQHMHVCQILAGMEEDGVLSEQMLLVALLHDLGKIAMLEGEPPEHVVCYITPIEAREPGCGLDNVIFQFGHDEIAYQRFKDHVPEDIAWALRYHSTILGSAEPYMSATDQGLGREHPHHVPEVRPRNESPRESTCSAEPRSIPRFRGKLFPSTHLVLIASLLRKIVLIKPARPFVGCSWPA